MHLHHLVDKVKNSLNLKHESVIQDPVLIDSLPDDEYDGDMDNNEA